MAIRPFWRERRLEELSRKEWESLCDGCARCCLLKLEDEETAEVAYTRVACRLLDSHSCRCTDYRRRLRRVPGCLRLTPESLPRAARWLPDTCAYRLLWEGRDLPEWHPLVTGDPESVHRAGISVRGRTVCETQVPEDEEEDHVIDWVGV